MKHHPKLLNKDSLSTPVEKSRQPGYDVSLIILVVFKLGSRNVQAMPAQTHVANQVIDVIDLAESSSVWPRTGKEQKEQKTTKMNQLRNECLQICEGADIIWYHVPRPTPSPRTSHGTGRQDVGRNAHPGSDIYYYVHRWRLALLSASMPYELTGDGMQQPRTWQPRRHGVYEEYTYGMHLIFSVQPRANTFLSKGTECSPRFGLGELGQRLLGLLTTIISFTLNPAVAS
ncbi:hypothetical protein TrVGV298_008466 [Trichoderma virens]|nr:hypothetical protein TrVGV298_008466 [Trichoderma virens]